MSIFLAYHCPCTDGAFSLYSAFVFFREIQKLNISVDDFRDYISQFKDYENINQTILEYKNLKTEPSKAMPEEEQKIDPSKQYNDDFSPSILDRIIYTPIKLTADGSFPFPYRNYRPEFLKRSMIIIMDYSGSTVEIVKNISESFAQLIIIDHHLTFENILNGLKTKDEYPQNMLHHYRKENSGAVITLEFFEKIKGSPLFSDERDQNKLLEVLRYVEDHDLRAEKVPNSEQFISGFISQRIFMDPNKNSGMFKSLYNVNIERMIDIGTEEQRKRIERSQELVRKHKVRVYLGGRTEGGKGKYGVCYGIETYELPLRSQIGHELAVQSVKDGLENMGVVFRKDKESVLWNLSLRSLKDTPGGNCEIIAREFAGGGHYNAAGCSLRYHEMKNWLEKGYFK